MPISRPALFSFLILTLIVILACNAATGSAPPDEAPGEPVGVLPTAVSSTQVPATTAQPALPERRRLTLEFPPQLRAGDSDRVRLTLEVDDLGNLTPTAEVTGNVVTGEVIEIPNLYESHHVIAEARFDIAGLEVQPAELISEPLAPGTSATFYWSIRPQDAGTYRGTVWLYLRFVNKTTGEESRKTVSAQIVEIKAINLLGLSGPLARTMGVVGSLVGTILGLPFFEDILKLLFRRRFKLK